MWEDLYNGIPQYIIKYNNLTNPHGVERNEDKGGILIPPIAPLTLHEYYKGIRLHVRRDGLTISGTPIGTKEYRDAFCVGKVHCTKDRIEGICRLS